MKTEQTHADENPNNLNGQSHDQSLPNRQVEQKIFKRKQEKILRINADDYSTKHLIIFWSIYLAFIILVGILTQVLPPTFIKLSNRETTLRTNLQNCNSSIGFNGQNQVVCVDNSSISKSVTSILLNRLSTKNQFLFIYLNFVLTNKGDSSVDLVAKIKINIYSLKVSREEKGRLQFTKDQKLQQFSMDFSLKSINSARIYEENGYIFKGYRSGLGYQNYVDSQPVLVVFQLLDWPLLNVDSVFPDVTSISPAFTVFSIVIRYVFFAVSLATTILYYLRYRTIPEGLKSLQQRFVLYLSILTVMFNDPLYAITILAPNGFTAFVSVAFVVNFVTFLVAFQMFFIDRIFYQSGQQYLNVLNKKKYAYFIIFYIVVFVLQFQLALLRLSDQPILGSDDTQHGGIVAFQIMSIIVFVCGLIYIAIQYGRCMPNFLNKIWRNQIFLLVSFLFIIVLVIMFVVNGFGVYEYVGNRILIFFTFMNMYVIYLQYMYSITSTQSQQLKMKNFLNADQNQVSTLNSNFDKNQIILDMDSQYNTPPEQTKNKVFKAVRESKQESQQFESQNAIQISNAEKNQKDQDFGRFDLQA